MYESPIDVICSDMQMKLENEVLKAVQRVGINVDNDELIKALSYDRQQYTKGYADGYADAQAEQRWIPVKPRPMTEEERQYYSEMYGYDVEYEEAVMYDCKMPEDGQEIWVCSKCGNVWQDTCVVDVGIGLEGNGDWDGIVAWMPFVRPEPWKGGNDNV